MFDIFCPDTNNFSVDWTDGTIAPGESTNVTVTFAPTDIGVYSGDWSDGCLVISDSPNENNGLDSIPVLAEGVEPDPATGLLVFSGDLNFGPVLVGSSNQLT